MYINATLTITDPSLSRLYYAIRGSDKSGQGWVVIAHSKLLRLLQISKSSLRRLLKQGSDLKWFQTVIWQDDNLFIKYTSEKSIVSKCNVSRECNVRYLENKANLKKKDLFVGKALLAVQVNLQTKAETKLQYLLHTGSLQLKPVVDQKFVESIKKIKSQRFVKKRSSYVTQDIFINPNEKKRLATVRIDKGEHRYSVGISQKKLSEVTGYCVNSISRLLKPFGDMRVQCIRSSTSKELFDDTVVTIEIATEDSFQSLKPLPYYYLDRITRKGHRERLDKHTLLKKLSPEELKVAMLSGILKGYPYSPEGAIEFLTKYGIKRFKRNTRILRQK